MLVTECLLENSAAPTVCFHADFPHCLFLGFSAGSMGIRAQLAWPSAAVSANRHWPVVKLGDCWLAPGLSSHCHWAQLPGPQSSPRWDYAQCSQYFTYCSLGCVSRSSECSWRVYWQESRQSGVAEGAGRNGVYFQCPRPFSSFFLNLIFSIHFVARCSSFLLSFVLYSYGAGVEVTFSPDIFYSCISAVALSMAPIATTTIRYPGENFQVLKFLRQAWLFYN